MRNIKFPCLGESSPCNYGFTDKIIVDLSCAQGLERKVWSEDESYDWPDSVLSYNKSSSGRIEEAYIAEAFFNNTWLSKDFENALDQLPAKFEDSIDKYFEFLKLYGTHKFQHVKFGGYKQHAIGTKSDKHQLGVTADLNADVFADSVSKFDATSALEVVPCAGSGIGKNLNYWIIFLK